MQALEARYGAGGYSLAIVAHDNYLQIAADSGIPAMLVYVVMVTLALHSLGRARRQILHALDGSDTEPLSPAVEDRLQAVFFGLEHARAAGEA